MSDSIQRETNSTNNEEIGENSNNSRTHEFLYRSPSPVPEMPLLSDNMIIVANFPKQLFDGTNHDNEQYSQADLQSVTVEDLLTENNQLKRQNSILQANLDLAKAYELLRRIEERTREAGKFTEKMEASLREASASLQRANTKKRGGITYASSEAEEEHLRQCKNEEMHAKSCKAYAERANEEIEKVLQDLQNGKLVVLREIERMDQQISSDPTIAAIQQQMSGVLSRIAIEAENAEREWNYGHINMEELVEIWSNPIEQWEANQLSPEEQKKLASRTNDPFRRLDDWYSKKIANCSKRLNDELLYLRLAHNSDLLKISKSKKDLILGKKFFAEQQFKEDSTAIGDKYYQISENIKAKYVEKKRKLQQKVEKREREYLHLKLQSASVSPENLPDGTSLGYFLLDKKKYPLLCIGDSSVAHHPYWNSFDGKIYYTMHTDEASREEHALLKRHPNSVGEVQFTLDDTSKKISLPLLFPSNRTSLHLSETSSSNDSSIEVPLTTQQPTPSNRGYLSSFGDSLKKKPKEQESRKWDLPSLEAQLENLRNEFYHDMTRLHKERHSRYQRLIDRHEEEPLKPESTKAAEIVNLNKDIDEKLRNIEKRFKEDETDLAHRIAKAHIRRAQLDTQPSSSNQERQFMQHYLFDQQASPNFQALIHKLEKKAAPQGSDAALTYRIQNRLNKNIYELPMAPGFVPSRFAFIDSKGQLHSTNSPLNFSRTADDDWFLVVHPDEAFEDTILVLGRDQDPKVQSSLDSNNQEGQFARNIIIAQEQAGGFQHFRQELARKQGKKVQQPGPHEYPVQDPSVDNVYSFPVVSGNSSMRFAYCDANTEPPELHFTNTLSNRPTPPPGWYLLVRRTDGDIPEAASLFLGEYQKKVQPADPNEAKLALRKQTAIPIVEQGDQFFKQNNFKKAFEKYNLAHPLDRENPVILQKRGNTYYRLNKFQASYDDLTESLKFARNSETLFYRGNALVGLNRPNDAINDLNEALGLETNPWQRATIYARMAYTYYVSLKNPQEAFKACERALSINKQQQEAQHVREQVLKKLSSDEVAAALSELDNSQPSSEEPEQPGGRPNAADLFRQGNEQGQEGNFEEALKFYNLTLQNFRGAKKENLAIIYAYRANTLIHLERYTESLKDLDLAIENNPKDGQSHYLRGFVLSELGRDLDALESFDLALTNGFQGIRVSMSRGTSNFKLGRYDEAENDYEEARKIDPENQDIRQSLEAIARKKAESRSTENPENSSTNLPENRKKLPPIPEGQDQTHSQLDAATLFGYGKKQVQQGNYEKAVLLYNLTLENYRGNNKKEIATIRSYRADALRLLERYPEALADCDLAIENDPKYGRSHYQRGLVLGRLGRDLDSLESFDLAFQNGYKNVNFYISRGTAYFKLERYDEAENDYEEARKIDPENQDVRQALETIARRKGQERPENDLDAATLFGLGKKQSRQGNHEKALELYDLTLENYRGNKKKEISIIRSYRANALRLLGRDLEALADYDQALENDPQNGRILYERGLVLSSLGQDLDDAVESFSLAIANNYKNVNVYVSRGSSYFRLERYDEAENDYEKARELDPENKEIKQSLETITRRKSKSRSTENTQELNAKTAFDQGKDLLRQSKREEALEKFKQATADNPRNAEYWFYAGIALGKLLDDSQEAYSARIRGDFSQYEEVLEYYKQAIDCDPNNAFYYYNRGITLDWDGRREEALADYQRASNCDLNNANYRHKAGLVLERLNRLEEALEYFQGAFDRKPNQAAYCSNLGRIYEKMENDEDALKYYKLASEKGKYEPDYCNNAGRILEKQGKLEEALEYFKKAHEIKADSPAALEGLARVQAKLEASEDTRATTDTNV